MRVLLTGAAAVFFMLLLPCSAAMAESDIERLERKIDALMREVEALKAKEEVVGELKSEIEALKASDRDVETIRRAVSRMEESEQEMEELREEVASIRDRGFEFLDRTTIGGYGELHYNDYKSEDKDSSIDFHRFVLFFSHEINDWIRFDSEVELEHSLSGEGKSGEVELEQAYLDFMLSKRINVRAGLMLMPVGIMNETHEPPTFYGVERPDMDKKIIPTTWWEAGVGIYGEILPGLNYRLYGVSSLDASGFSASSGLRGGRQKVSKARAEDLALTGRLEYTGLPGLKIGGSFFWGDTSQNDDAYGDATVTILEGDVQASIWQFDFKGQYAHVYLDDAYEVSTANAEAVGEEMYGWYVEGGFRLLGLIFPESEQEFALFARYSEYDTQDEVASGFTADGKNDVEVLTIGLDYKPHPNIVIKLDYQDRDNDSSTIKAADQFNLGVGYWF
ncbi:MAG: porin [Thermodesulfobacteriota bacterium]